jgi:hypothetical protein
MAPNEEVVGSVKTSQRLKERTKYKAHQGRGNNRATTTRPGGRPNGKNME